MKNEKIEVNRMTNLQTSALLEAIKIITETIKDPEEIEKALDRIQSKIEKN